MSSAPVRLSGRYEN
uniref:Uncharacterized protein n=1 Tax=Anguilla anguilla TaxID=7936 RepID=A0A0E9UD75_ANGAN